MARREKKMEEGEANILVEFVENEERLGGRSLIWRNGQ
jgi:hypothetical protein